jgi:uncharacterized protein YyaL (SSP411 family)
LREIVTPVRWLSWNTAAFARARAEDKPVLLSIVAPWCASCREMDCTTYADPGVAATVNDRFVAIRVDADRRPDISERYSLGGWPTTAFLTADGRIVGGGTYVPVDRMPSVLERVVEAFTSELPTFRASELPGPPPSRAESPRASARPRRSLPAGSLPTSEGGRAPSPESRAPSPDLVATTYASFDSDHGGFGVEPKFPLAAPLELALASYRDSRDGRMAHIVQVTLDAMGWGGLYDDVDGGFFRCAGTRDWQAPRQEKLLEVNAAMLKVYLDASETLKIARYRERAGEILRYVQTWLADPVDGGWAGSQQADGAYYAAASDGRRGGPPPPVDPVLYAAANASMASSALRAAQLLDDTSLGEFALKSLERVLIACYSPGAGVAHYLDGRPEVRGLLDDQIAMASAQLDAHAATGNIVYEMMAQELAHYAVRTMWDEEGGGFFDRSVADEQERIGLMRDRLKPFVGNCEAARLLKRLAATCGEAEFADRAEATLATMAPLASAQGPLAAHYLLAQRAPEP